MNSLDLFLKKYSYKFEKGYPDLSNPKDKILLESLINEVTKNPPSLITEEQSQYDKTIKSALGLESNEEIPKAKGNYSLKDHTFTEHVSNQDKTIFNKLYNAAPPKKDEEEGATKGVGNGEVALYWLYQHSDSGLDVTTDGAGSNPDMFIGGKGVEVKAFGTHKGKLALGRFGSDKENLKLLNIIFGIKVLGEILGQKEKGAIINPTNFRGVDLIAAFKQVLDLEKTQGLEELAKQYNVFSAIKQNLDFLNDQLGNPVDEKEAATNLISRIAMAKLSTKPGDGGYLASVLKSGEIKFFKIDLKRLENDEIIDNFAAKQSTIYLDFSKIFS